MRAKIGKKGIKKRIVRAVLVLAMAVALMPMYSIKTYAAPPAPSPSRSLNGLKTIYDDNWYIDSEGRIVCKCRNWYLTDTEDNFLYLWDIDNAKLIGPGGEDELKPGHYCCGDFRNDPSVVPGVAPEGTCKVTLEHVHDWRYSATDNKLEAYCANKCCPSETDENHKVSLVLSAEDTGYTGKSYTGASLAGVDAWKKVGLDIPEIEYCGRGDTKHDSKIPPKDVGTYTAKITVGCATASVDFAITEDKPSDKPKKQGKTDEERAEELRQVAAMMAAYQDFYEFHPLEWAYVNEQYAINPALGLDASLKIVANTTYEEYMAQMAAYFAQYADQMALYEAMMNAQNAQ